MRRIENCLTPLVTVAAFKYKVSAFVIRSALIVDDSKYCLINICSPFEITLNYYTKQESVRPRWPYDMRPSVRAEKYIRDASG